MAVLVYLVFRLSISFFSQISFFCRLYRFSFCLHQRFGCCFMMVIVLMMMIYVLIRFSLIYSCSQGSHKSAQVWIQAWLHATDATANTLHGTGNTGARKTNQTVGLPGCHQRPVFPFYIKFNDNYWWTKTFLSRFFCSEIWGNKMSPFNITHNIRSEVSECFCQRSVHWSQMAKKEGGRERRLTEMLRKSKDRMTNWVVWDSPAILHQTRNANMHTNHTYTNKLTSKCWSIESRPWIQLLALNHH